MRYENAVARNSYKNCKAICRKTTLSLEAVSKVFRSFISFFSVLRKESGHRDDLNLTNILTFASSAKLAICVREFSVC